MIASIDIQVIVPTPCKYKCPLEKTNYINATQIPLWMKNNPPLKLEVPSKDPTSPSTQSVRKTQLSLCLPVLQKSILCWVGASPLRAHVHAKSWPNMHVLDCRQPVSSAVCHAQNWEALPIPGQCTAACPAQSPSPAQTQAPTQSPRQQDCQSARGGHSCLFSKSHGSGFNIFASGTTLIDGSLKLCAKLYRSGKLSSNVT